MNRTTDFGQFESEFSNYHNFHSSMRTLDDTPLYCNPHIFRINIRHPALQILDGQQRNTFAVLSISPWYPSDTTAHQMLLFLKIPAVFDSLFQQWHPRHPLW